MPSIKQEDLDDLNERVERQAETIQDHIRDKEVLHAQLDSYNRVLDKILRAANGQSLIENPNRGGMGGYALTPGYPGEMRYVEPCGHQRGPTEDERHQQQVGELNARIVGLECRLAAVTAAAEFAKEHKAGR